MAAKGECLGFEKLVVGAAVVALANIPPYTTMIRVYYNKSGTTGNNVVSMMYFNTPDLRVTL